MMDLASELGLTRATVDGPTLLAFLDSLPVPPVNPGKSVGSPSIARPTMSPGFPCFADGYSNQVTPVATPVASPNASPRITPDNSRRSSYLDLDDTQFYTFGQGEPLASGAEAVAAALARAPAALPPLPPPALAMAASADVLFAPNLPRPYRLRLLGAASVGLHTVPGDPFGTSVVELMAAGVPPVAHMSGGPLYDVVGTSGEVGLLATSAEEYAAAMAELLLYAPARRRRMASRARKAAVRDLSEDEFARRLCRALRPLVETV